MASTFVTSMLCVKHIGEYWPETVGLALNHLVNFNYIFGFLMVCGIILFYALFKYMRPLQNKTMEEYTIENSFKFYFLVLDSQEQSSFSTQIFIKKKISSIVICTLISLFCQDFLFSNY